MDFSMSNQNGPRTALETGIFARHTRTSDKSEYVTRVKLGVLRVAGPRENAAQSNTGLFFPRVGLKIPGSPQAAKLRSLRAKSLLCGFPGCSGMPGTGKRHPTRQSPWI